METKSGKPSAARKALVIHHLRPVFEDRATAALIRAGYEPDHRFPIEGDPLPDPQEGHAIALMHGSLADCTKLDEPGMAEEHHWIRAWWKTDRPYFGICHGFQLASMALGGHVGPPEHRKAEFGYFPLNSNDPALVPDGLHVFQWHYYGAELPAGCERIAGSDLYPNQVVRFGPRRIGVQFHAEMGLEGQRHLRATVPDWKTRDGVQTDAVQEDLAARHYQPMANWFDGFLHQWLASCEVPVPV